MARDMTRGPIAGTLVAFTVPLILSGLLQQLYSWADALIVGNVIGEAPLAAVGATISIYALSTAVLSGFSVGISVLVARAFGAGETGRIGAYTSTFLLFMGAFSLVLAVPGVLFSAPLLSLLKTPDDIFAFADVYLRIMLLGVPVMAVYNIYTAILRGIGDSRTPLLSIFVSAITNIALDLLFVVVFHWGIAGAAFATILAQLFMTIFIAIYAHRKYSILRFKWNRQALDKQALKEGLSLSVPTAMQSGIRSLGGLLLQNIMNTFGTQTVAAITTAYRIDSVVMLPVINLGAGLSTFTAQNHGAKIEDRMKKGFATGLLLSIGISVLMTAIVVPFSGRLMGIFGISPESILIGSEFFGAIALFYPVFGCINVFTGYLQGKGDVMFVGLSHIAALFVRIGLSYLLAGVYGNLVIAWAEIYSWGFQLLLCLVRFLYLRKKSRVPA